MSPTPTATKAKKNPKTGEALKKQARKEIAERIAQIDAAEPTNAAATNSPVADPKPAAKKAKAEKPAKPPKPDKPKKLGVLDAAAKVLRDAGKPLTAGEIMQVMLDKKIWSTRGKTPHQTLFAAALREIKAKGNQARFTKPEPGKFAFNAAKKEA
jgi:hypothetical protein